MTIYVQVTASNSLGSATSAPSERTATIEPAQPAALAPETTITSAPPPLTTSRSASFSFSSPNMNVTFECQLDSPRWSSCSSPKTYADLAEGDHIFAVRARDATDNPDRSPATHAWRVDTTPPETTIESGPSGTVTTDSVSFSFAGEAGSTYECRFDGGPWTPCTSPRTYGSPLSIGPHRFEVRATDAAGWKEPSPTGRSFERQPNCSTGASTAGAGSALPAAAFRIDAPVAVAAAGQPDCARTSGAA